MGYSLLLDAVEAKPSVTSISVHLHIENTTVRRGTQRLARTRTTDERRQADRHQHRDDAGDAARLVEEHREILAHQRTDFPCGGRQGRADIVWHRSEENQPTIGDDERHAKRQDELRIVPFTFGARDAHARHPREQSAVQEYAKAV